jgi:hypothetical protein
MGNRRSEFDESYPTGYPEMAQITIEEGAHLYREIHVEYQLTDAEGQTSSLTPSAEIDVILEPAPMPR